MKFGKRSMNNLMMDIDHRLIIFATAFLHKHPNYDIAVVESLRTLEKQKEYVAKGVSWTLKSRHLEGKALDIYPVGWQHFSEKAWDKWNRDIEVLANELGFPIKCGWGMWKKDAFHIELRD